MDNVALLLVIALLLICVYMIASCKSKGEGYQQLLATSAPSGSYVTEQSYWDCVKANCGEPDGGRNPYYFDCSEKCYYDLFANSGGDDGACYRTCETYPPETKLFCLQQCYGYNPAECERSFGNGAYPEVP
jgi:hypothetical protein